MDSASAFHWKSAAASHPGLIRAVNEDAFLDQPERGIWSVADGMGGHSFGQMASRTVVEQLGGLPVCDSLATLAAEARQRLQAVNRQLRTEARMRRVPVIGSTVAVLLSHGNQCGCLWAGDSRIYLRRDGALTQLTRDHSQAEEFKALYGTELPNRNVITRAIGAAETLDLDYKAIDVNDQDIFLLCSDGLSNEVAPEGLLTALACASCRQAAEALVDMALRQGGRDNISAVVVHAWKLDLDDRTVVNPVL